MRTKVKTERVSCGNYTIKACGRTFDIDRTEYADWQLCEVVEGADGVERREYWNHFATKRAAVAAVTTSLAA